MLIELKNLSKSYGPIRALQNVSLAIPSGCIGLLGSNGAGKSTMIRLLLGLLRPDGGEGTVLDFDIRRRPAALRRRVGYLPEHDCFFDHMSAVRYVMYAGKLSGLPPVPAMQRAHEMLDFVGLDEARYRPLGTYSMGMKQRVKLAQAIVHGPELLFLDEPTNGMDPRGRAEMLDLVDHLHKKAGISIVLCSHILPDVERVCDSVVVLHQGQVAAHKSMEELRRRIDERVYVTADGDLDALMNALNAAGLPAGKAGERELCFEEEDGVAWGPIVLRTAGALNMPVRRMGRKSPTLEDIYLDLVNRAPSGEK